jgi:signal transduction histidine kinase
MWRSVAHGCSACGDDGVRDIVIRSQQAENQQVLVSISDTGVGIAPQIAEHIFDPFFTTKLHGTGMGLRICRSIIEAHGGQLWAAGSPRARRDLPIQSSRRIAGLNLFARLNFE